MARRKRRRGEKRTANARPGESAEPSPALGTDETLPPPLRPNPPRRNLPLLVVSTVLTLGWIVFLVFMVVGR